MRNPVRAKRFILLSILLLSAIWAMAQSKMNRTTETIVVKSKSPEHKKQEFVKLVFTVINDTDVQLEITKDQFYFPKCVSVMITGPNGNVACKVPDHTGTSFPKVSMKAGSYLEFEYNISGYWDLSAAGEYKVVFYYTMSNGVSKAAPVASFKILD